jgi:exodeoxyribonuclease V alpha subunit
MPELEMRRGVVAKWRIQPRDNERFGVLLLENDSTPYAGAFPAVERGDELAVFAFLNEHPRYGAQYKVQKVVMHIPGKSNLVNWMLLRFPNIGPVRARQIKEQFGETIWNVLENDPQQLTAIDGITEERATQLAEAYEREKKGIEVFLSLLQLGVDPKVLIALIKKDIHIWQLQEWLDKDVYQLAAQGLLRFDEVDPIGEVKEIEKEDPRRVCGAVVSILRDRRKDGHTATPFNVLRMDARRMLRVTDEVVEGALNKAAELPFPSHFAFFGQIVQWMEHAEADLVFAQALGVRDATVRT